jgi:hypothetical protein
VSAREWLLVQGVRRPIGTQPEYTASAQIGEAHALGRKWQVEYGCDGRVVERDRFVCLHDEHALLRTARQREQHQRLNVGRDRMLV